MMKHILSLYSKASLALCFTSILLLSGCEEDEPGKSRTEINLSNSTLSMSESAVSATITLTLAEAAKTSGTVTISFSGATYTDDYTTDPDGSSGSIELEILKGDEFIAFELYPNDNEDVDGDKTLTLTLASTTGGVSIGSAASLVVTMVDDEGPSAANFTTASGTINKQAGETTLTIAFVTATTATGTLTVGVTTDATYTSDYTTAPDGAAGSFTLAVEKGATEATFSVTPNEDLVGDKILTFTLTDATNGLKVGASQVTYELTITGELNITPIADVVALYDAANSVTLGNNLVIQGVVTSRNEALSENNLFIQDESGAILLRFSNPHSFTQGTELQTVLDGAVVTGYNGLIQVTGLALTTATSLGTSDLPNPEVITIEQLNTNEYQSKLIQIEDVSIAEADGIETFYGNRTLTDGSHTTIIRVESYADFADEILPLGSGTVVGIAGYYNTAQILPQARSDVFDNNPSGTISLSTNSLDFGTVANGATSGTITYTVESTTLTENITVTAPAYFEVSTDGTTFSQSIALDYTQTNTAPVTIYVRFSASSGVNQEITGTLTHTVAGAATQSITVTGTENGNAASPLVETFDNLTIASSGSYLDGTFTGINGIEWTYVESISGSVYPIDGNGMLLRRSDEPSSLSATITGGIVTFSVQMRKAYTGTGDRQIEVFVNDTSIGQSETFGSDSGEDTEVHTFSVSDIDVSGTFTLEIRNISAKQLVIDNVTWTGYE